MSLPRLIRATLSVLLLAALLACSASGALVEVGNIVLRADGSFQPQTLPRRSYSPIEFKGFVDVAAKGGGKPSPLLQAVVDFDHDGRLTVAGLPTCSPESVASASTEEARRICRGAIVGTGDVEALVTFGGATVPVRAPLTVFNGPPLGGRPTVVLHARTSVPQTQTYAILAPIQKRRGEFRYRVTLDLPPIAAGYGALTHLDVDIGRRYRSGGSSRSYVSARCSDHILRTHGRFTFEDGTVIDGQVEKYCRSK